MDILGALLAAWLNSSKRNQDGVEKNQDEIYKLLCAVLWKI